MAGTLQRFVTKSFKVLPAAGLAVWSLIIGSPAVDAAHMPAGHQTVIELNLGMVMLFMAPYITFGLFAYLIYRAYRRQTVEDTGAAGSVSGENMGAR